MQVHHPQPFMREIEHLYFHPASHFMLMYGSMLCMVPDSFWLSKRAHASQPPSIDDEATSID